MKQPDRLPRTTEKIVHNGYVPPRGPVKVVIEQLPAKPPAQPQQPKQ